MRTRMMWPVVALAIVAACGSTPIQRELQYAKSITAANDSAATALDLGIIDADTGEAIQAVTRTATEDLKRAVKARRGGAGLEAWKRLLDIVDDALVRVADLLGEK